MLQFVAASIFTLFASLLTLLTLLTLFAFAIFHFFYPLWTIFSKGLSAEWQAPKWILSPV